MKVIIIDDEPKQRAQLKNLLAKHCEQVELICEAGNAADGAKLIIATKPDLVFLDIQMPKQSGFEMLAALGKYEFDVIFVTGYDQYGIQAVKCSALDYLLKPVKPVELIAAVNKAVQRQKTKDIAKQIEILLDLVRYPHKTDQPIILSSTKGLQLVSPYEIIKCEADNNYTQVYLKDGRKLLATKLLGELEEMLAPFGFLRPHHSYVVNKKCIKTLIKGSVVYELKMSDDSLVPVSGRRLKEFKDNLTPNP